jgi:O-antigen ligase
MKFNPIMYFFLSPLIYSVDGDPYRTYEVLLVAVLFPLLFIRGTIHKTYLLDIISVFLFSGFLIIQQFLVSTGDVVFGINFFIIFIAAFTPFWMLRSVHWHYPGLERGLKNGINLLFWIAFLSISLSFFTGMGERYSGGIVGYRAFGFLGDAFSAVMAFLLLFYIINGSRYYAFMSGITILMMGAKTSILMVIFCIALYSLFIKKSLSHKVLGLAGVACLVSLPYFLDWLLDNLQNLEFSMMNRLISYQLGIDYFLESPIFGIGINQGLGRAADEAKLIAEALDIVKYFPVFQVQNPYLRVLSETGLIGFSLFLILVCFLVTRAIKSIRFAILLPKSIERSIILAGALWVIGFVCVYQTTGWFVPGHPQLTWLLMFSTLSIILVERKQAGHVNFVKLRKE